MNVFQGVGLAAGGWGSAFRGLLHPPVREPFLLLFGVQLLLLIALGYFHAPVLAPIMEPVVRWLGGEEATHYPEHFWALPEILRNAELVVFIVLGPLALGVGTLRFARGSAAWGEAFARTPALLTLGVLGPGLSWTITSLFDLIPLEFSLQSFVIRMGLQAAELLSIALVYTALAYSIAFVLIAGRPLGPALRDSIRLAARLPIPTFLLVAVPLAILFPPTFFMYEMDMGEAGLPPDAVGLLLTARILLQVIFAALSVGGLTDLFLHSTGPRR
jgi:hypothetical protein